MKKLLYILLLLTEVCFAQSYEFESIDKRLYKNGWEIRKIVGSVVITDSTVVISTPFNTQVLKVLSPPQRFIRHDDKIFSCRNENGDKINLRLYCEDKLRKYFDLYYYSNDPDNKYYRFCLTQID